MKISLILYGNESRIVMIRKDGRPFLMINLYLLTRKRNLSVSRQSYLCTSLKRITSYFDLQDENFEKILIEENYDFLISKLPNFFNNYLTQYNLSDSAYQDHIIFIRDYILWVINRQFSRCYSKKRQLYETYTRKIENIFSVLQLKYKRKIQNFKNIGEDHIKKVIDKFSEKKDNHPLYYRNFLIIELLSETGIRAGELLNLKTFDILFNSAIVKIIQSDLVDSRANKPNLKNIQSNRGIAISNELVHQLEYFILTIRRITYKSKKSKLDHPYLFTSLLGRPLSKSSIQNLFDKINDEFPYFDSNNKLIKITPHSIRHTFSYSFIKYAIEEKEMEIDRAKDELRKICGWNAASTMPDLYAGKYIWEKANLHNLERIRKLYEK